MQEMRAIGLTLLLFLAVYPPASAVVAVLRLQPAAAVPVVMLLTLIAACLLIRLLASRGQQRIADYGFSIPAPRYIVSAVMDPNRNRRWLARSDPGNEKIKRRDDGRAISRRIRHHRPELAGCNASELGSDH